MSNTELVRVDAGESGSDTATLLLAAAANKDNDFSAADVRTNTEGTSFGFVVPRSLAKAAGLEGTDHEESNPYAPASAQTEETAQAVAEALVSPGATGPDAAQMVPAQKKAPAKKAAAKKTAAKKTAKKAAKKAPAKKSTTKASE